MHRTHAALEAHATAATLYLRGTISHADLAPQIDAIRRLPETVRSLRVDMRALRGLDADICDTLFHLIDVWRRSRPGPTQVIPVLPRATTPREPRLRVHRSRTMMTPTAAAG